MQGLGCGDVLVSVICIETLLNTTVGEVLVLWYGPALASMDTQTSM